MLILSRKPGESIVIDGRILVKVVRLDGELVKLGIDAPADIAVHRQEVYDEIQRNNREAVAHEGVIPPRLSAAKASSHRAAPGSTVISSPAKPDNPT
jgi:carbon storage regulator